MPPLEGDDTIARTLFMIPQALGASQISPRPPLVKILGFL